MNWLDEVELGELGELFADDVTTEQLEQRFKITDLSSMNWALRKLSALGKNHAEEFELANAEIDRIQSWFKKQDEAFQYSKQFIEGLIGKYAKEQRKLDEKWKGKSPYGKVGFRKQQPMWDYGDEDKLVKYMEENGLSDMVKIEKKPMKAELKLALIVKDEKAINALTGEVVPGIMVEDREPVLTIKLEG